MKEKKELTKKVTITATETTKKQANEVSKELLGQENISGLFTKLVGDKHKQLVKEGKL